MFVCLTNTISSWGLRDLNSTETLKKEIYNGNIFLKSKLEITKKEKTRPTVGIELSISGRCRDRKELGNCLHETNKIQYGRIPCFEYKYDLLLPTIYHTGALWISRASKAFNTSIVVLAISQYSRFATRKIFPTFWEDFRWNTRTSFVVSLFSRVFHQWT